ncbi:MAG: pyridine nucleotide-disulfide oxidoreductase, partial [Oscillospiraceae bacterium]|nr:pyridine nucleotide-disulfide oxidoreductase [Oscillospiraceae bacterium]
MAGERELILKLGKKITDRVDVKLGMTKLDANSPEYYGLASVVTDEMAELALAMDVRVPITPEKLAKKVGKRTEEVRALLDQMSGIGLLEYNWENANHEKQYVLPIFVPGCAELMNMHIEQTEEHPEIPKFFDNMAFMPLTKITPMVPPGGSGVGMHVIPVEKAIPAKNESVDVEHLSHWLKKYEGQLGVGYCSCRNAMRIAGDGCGELQDELCIAVGQFAKYCEENNMGRPITYEEAMEILQRAEDNGYVHQITN